MKVFEIDDCDWWAGEDLESVKAAYMKETGVGEEEIAEARELTEEEMRTLLFTDETTLDPDGGLYKIPFAEHLAHLEASGVSFPCFFATTEY